MESSNRLYDAYQDLGRQAREYMIDAAQRSVLYTDAMRKRGNLYLEHGLQGKPPLLKFNHEVIADGRDLERPCNYSLLHILPDQKTPTDPAMRPIVIVDPRAGHGPGIGGFKPDSQVGVALRAGHPVYFISFAPRPIEGQTLADVLDAEAHFLELVKARHPNQKQNPAVIGNCQAGWAVATLAAVHPEITGPILLNGAPLSYWAGSSEQNPMRYGGGKLGGSWVAAFAADMGAGQFDGSHLVRNFESLNPANTYWTKQYDLYANIDKGEERFLEFERWWGGYFRMTGQEIETIVDGLFVGNKLARGTLKIGEHPINLRNITSPIVVFASQGDNITPPSQALNWIMDVWGDERAIVNAGRTIVYMVHDAIGHLGIFVGSGVARKEHDQLVHTLDEIEQLPPGLYEMVMEAKSSSLKYDALSYGQYSVKFKPRTMDDIRDLDPDGREDERVFSTVAQVSDVNMALYKAWVQPWLRAVITESAAEMMASMAPGRVSNVVTSDFNPVMKSFASVAEKVRAARKPVSDGENVFVKLERRNARKIEHALDAYRERRDAALAQWVEWMYGPFALGAMFPPDRSDESRAHEAAQADLAAAKTRLARRIDQGGFAEGLMRMLLIAFHEKGSIRRRSIRLAEIAAGVANDLVASGKLKRVKGGVDWRAIRDEQASILALFPEQAVAALPKLLANKGERQLACAMVGRIMLVEPEAADPRSALAVKAQELLGTSFQAAAANDELPAELVAIGMMQSA